MKHKIIDTSHYDINKWTIPYWLQKEVSDVETDSIDSMKLELIPTNEVDIKNYDNLARYEKIDWNLVADLEADFRNPDIGYLETEEPCVVIRKKVIVDALSKTYNFVPPCSYHRLNGGVGVDTNGISNIPAVVIDLKDHLSSKEQNQRMAIIGRKEHLRHKPKRDTSDNDHASGIYNEIINTDSTKTEQRLMLKDIIAKDYKQFRSEKRKRISDNVEKMFKWYQPIVRYTKPVELKDWAEKQYSRDFEYRGEIIDNLVFGDSMRNGFFKHHTLISNIHNILTVPVTWDDGSEDRDRQRLITNFKYDFENGLDRQYFIFLHITSSDRIGNLKENRIKFSKNVDNYLEWICKHPKIKRERIHIIAFLPHDQTGKLDSSMSSLIDYVEFKRDNGI
jgi:hypothetical protein